jgi:hypothetical protein
VPCRRSGCLANPNRHKSALRHVGDYRQTCLLDLVYRAPALISARPKSIQVPQSLVSICPSSSSMRNVTCGGYLGIQTVAHMSSCRKKIFLLLQYSIRQRKLAEVENCRLTITRVYYKGARVGQNKTGDHSDSTRRFPRCNWRMTSPQTNESTWNNLARIS